MLNVESADRPIPSRPDGQAWPHIMVHGGPNGDIRACADTAGELLGHYIEGYSDQLSDEDAAVMLAEHSATLAMQLQRQGVQVALERGDIDPTPQYEPLLAVLYRDKMLPIPPLPTGPLDWNEDVPLVLTTAVYGPQDFPPAGNVIWLDCGSSEVDYLSSLASLGLFAYVVPDPLGASA